MLLNCLSHSYYFRPLFGLKKNVKQVLKLTFVISCSKKMNSPPKYRSGFIVLLIQTPRDMSSASSSCIASLCLSRLSNRYPTTISLKQSPFISGGRVCVLLICSKKAFGMQLQSKPAVSICKCYSKNCFKIKFLIRVATQGTENRTYS